MAITDVTPGLVPPSQALVALIQSAIDASNRRFADTITDVGRVLAVNNERSNNLLLSSIFDTSGRADNTTIKLANALNTLFRQTQLGLDTVVLQTQNFVDEGIRSVVTGISGIGGDITGGLRSLFSSVAERGSETAQMIAQTLKDVVTIAEGKRGLIETLFDGAIKLLFEGIKGFLAGLLPLLLLPLVEGIEGVGKQIWDELLHVKIDPATFFADIQAGRTWGGKS